MERWYLGLCHEDPATADGIADAIEQLAEVGPALGRPLVDRIHGSRHHNMTELRPAVFLVAGDKSGRWETWYRQAIPIADARFDEHLIALKARQEQNSSEPDRRTGRQRPKEDNDREVQLLERRQGQGRCDRSPH